MFFIHSHKNLTHIRFYELGLIEIHPIYLNIEFKRFVIKNLRSMR